MRVFESRLNPLFVVELLVHGVLGLMGAFFDSDIHTEPRWESSQQSDSQR